MNQHIDTICDESQERTASESADLSHWAQLGESYQPEWFPLGPGLDT